MFIHLNLDSSLADAFYFQMDKFDEFIIHHIFRKIDNIILIPFNGSFSKMLTFEITFRIIGLLWSPTGLNIFLSMQEKQEIQVWSLDQEDALQEEMATHSSIFA